MPDFQFWFSKILSQQLLASCLDHVEFHTEGLWSGEKYKVASHNIFNIYNIINLNNLSQIQFHSPGTASGQFISFNYFNKLFLIMLDNNNNAYNEWGKMTVGSDYNDLWSTDIVEWVSKMMIYTQKIKKRGNIVWRFI